MSIKPIDPVHTISPFFSTLVYRGLKLNPSLRAGNYVQLYSCHGWIIRLCVLRVRYNVLMIPLNMAVRGVHNVVVVE